MTEDKLKQIKQTFRLRMNGVASRSMRDKGMDYPRLVINRLRNDLIRSGEMLPAAVIAAGLDLPLLGNSGNVA